MPTRPIPIIYSRKEVTKGLLSLVNNTLNEQIRHDKLTSYNIPELQNIMQDFDKRYSARTIKWSEDGSANECRKYYQLI